MSEKTTTIMKTNGGKFAVVKNGDKVICDNCRYEYAWQNLFRYCPVCGAKIIKSEDKNKT